MSAGAWEAVQPNTVATLFRWKGRRCDGLRKTTTGATELRFGDEIVEYTPGMQQWMANIIQDRIDAAKLTG